MAGSEQAPSEVLQLLEAKERAARERAAQAEEQAQLAAVARAAAEERLLRYGGQLPDDSLELPIELAAEALDEESNESSLEAEITRELSDLVQRRRKLQAELKRQTAHEAEVLQQLSALEDEIEIASRACAEAARAVIEFQKAEDRARRNAQSSQEAAARALRERQRCEARVEQEADAERLATERAESEEANLEQVSLERSIATRTALEQAAIEEDALERAAAARHAAKRAESQRIATERALETALANLRRRRGGAPTARQRSLPFQTHPEAARTEAAVAARSEASTAESALPGEPAVAASLDSTPSSVGSAPTTWFPSDDDAVPSDLPLEWLGNEHDLEVDELDSAAPAATTTWFADDDEDEPAVSAAEESESSSPPSPPDPAIEDPDHDVWESALARDEELRRAAAELERMERTAVERAEATTRERQRIVHAVEAELGRYEHAARGEQSSPSGDTTAAGLYRGQSYAWEAQAALGVQQRIAAKREALQQRTPEASAAHARASTEAAEAIRERIQRRSPPPYQAIAAVSAALLIGVVGTTFLLLRRSSGIENAEAASLVPSPVTAAVQPQVSGSPALAGAGAPVQLEERPTTPPSGIAPSAVVAPGAESLPEAAPQSESGRTELTPAPANRTAPSTTIELEPSDWPAWRRYAVPILDVGPKPRIAIVIDDMGVDEAASAQIIRLPGPLTVSFLPQAERLNRQANAARAAGHELMAHIPMEPLDVGYDPGPGYLADGLPATELRQRLKTYLDRYDFGIVGINNHMGSRFTRNGPGMMIVMAELLQRKMLFLDSRTVRQSVGARKAAEFGLPFAIRDVFLDHKGSPTSELDIAKITEQLRLTESIARRKGSAIAIGHPHRETIQALQAWIPEAKKRGVALVPITEVVRYQAALRAEQDEDAVAAKQP